MLSLRFLCRQLEPFVIQGPPATSEDACSHHMELLEEQETLRADRLYLGGPEARKVLETARIERGTVALLAGMDSADRPVPLPGCVILLFSCSLAKLYNTVAASIVQAEEWQLHYQVLSEKGCDIRELLTFAARSAEGGAALLDPKGRIIETIGIEEGSYLGNQLALTGALPQETLRKIFSSSLPPDCHRQQDIPGTDLALYIRRIAHDGEVLCMLLVEERHRQIQRDVRSLCDCTAECLRQRLLSQGPVQWGAATKEFQRCWEDIMERRLINRGEIRAALSQLPFPVRKYNQVIIISFRGECASVPYHYVLNRLRDFFPETNMAVYEKDIVLLLSYAERTFVLPALEEDQPLSTFLARYNAIMMVGNGTKNDEGLGSIYLLCKRTIELAYLLRENTGQRIFFSENYLIYSIIDLCVQRYLEAESNDDILYLTHPAVTALTRYDREHNTDLRDVLFHYLLNNRNLTATANAMYMHRNKINKKDNQIKKLIQLNLDEPRLSQRLLLSCQIMRYYEIVMQREMQ